MNFIKRVAVFIIGIMVFQLSCVPSFAADIDGNGTESNPYKISTAEELFWFAGLVNGNLTDGSEKNTSACAILTEDIVINDADLNNSANRENATEWIPIGSTESVYSGVFDGNGKTIKGLYIKNNGTNRGMFACASGEIKNLTIENAYIETVRIYYTGVIAGILDGAKVENCNVQGFIKVKTTSSNVGGISGISKNGSVIENCINKTDIESDGNISGSYLGGISGVNDSSTIKLCENNAEVWSWGRNTRTAGITSKNINKSYVIDCVNNKRIAAGQNDYAAGIVNENDSSTISGCTNNGDIHGSYYSGVMLAGIAINNKNGGLITDCRNTKSFDMESAQAAGIVLGVYDSFVENCVNEGDISGNYGGGVGGIVSRLDRNSTVRNCYNTGKITMSYLQSNSWSAVGQIVARCSENNGCKVENCFASSSEGEIFGTNTVVAENCYYLSEEETDENEGTTFKTAEQFASGEVCWLLNGEGEKTIFYQTIGVDLIPSFIGKKVYYSEERGFFNME